MTGLYAVGLIGSHGYAHLSAVRDLVSVLCTVRPTLHLLTRSGRSSVDRTVRREARRHGARLKVVRPMPLKAGLRPKLSPEYELVAQAREVHAFWDGRSAGTLHAIALARASGVPVHVHGLIE